MAGDRVGNLQIKDILKVMKEAKGPAPPNLSMRVLGLSGF